jgi:hypothetical protein
VLVDAERRRWLETVAAACERLIAEGERDPEYASLVDDAEELLARVRDELAARSREP